MAGKTRVSCNIDSISAMRYSLVISATCYKKSILTRTSMPNTSARLSPPPVSTHATWRACSPRMRDLPHSPRQRRLQQTVRRWIAMQTQLDAAPPSDEASSQNGAAQAAPGGDGAADCARSGRAGGSARSHGAPAPHWPKSALRFALSHLTAWLAQISTAMPKNPDGHDMQLVVVGMGKLGGDELNVSSDIDLIYLYPEEGETTGAKPVVAPRVFHPAGQKAQPGDLRHHRRRLRVPRRHAAAPMGRRRAAGDELRRARRLPRDPRARVGALRLDQGARADRHPAGTN